MIAPARPELNTCKAVRAAAIGLLSLTYQITATPIMSALPLLRDTMDFLTTGQCFTLVFWGALLGILGSWLGMQRFGSWR